MWILVLRIEKSGIIIIEINRIGKEVRANFPMPIIYT